MSRATVTSCVNEVDYDKDCITCEVTRCGPYPDPKYDCSPCSDVIICKGERGLPGPQGARGPRGSDCYCDSQFNYLVEQFPYPAVDTVDYSVAVGSTSYLTTSFILPECPLTSQAYTGWCLDLYDDINTGVQYQGIGVPILQSQAAFTQYYVCNPDIPIYTQYLPAVLSILNNINGYTVSDIQSAIWTILFALDPMSSPPLNGTPVDRDLAPNPTMVKEIIANALAAQALYEVSGELEDIAPNCIDVLVLFTASEGDCVQIICACIDMCTLDRCPSDTTSLFLTTSEVGVTIDQSTVGNSLGSLITLVESELRMWPYIPPNIIVPVTGLYEITIKASFRSSTNDPTPISITTGMTVNGSTSLFILTNSVSSSVMVHPSVATLVSHFATSLLQGDTLAFYAATDIVGGGTTGAVAINGFSPLPQPWYTVVINQL